MAKPIKPARYMRNGRKQDTVNALEMIKAGEPTLQEKVREIADNIIASEDQRIAALETKLLDQIERTNPEVVDALYAAAELEAKNG